MMNDETPDVRVPEDETDVLEIAGAETDEERALAVAQARMIGDVD